MLVEELQQLLSDEPGKHTRDDIIISCCHSLVTSPVLGCAVYSKFETLVIDELMLLWLTMTAKFIYCIFLSDENTYMRLILRNFMLIVMKGY